MFWRPPTSLLCSSGTDDTVTAPSCEASAPMPRPASSIGQVTISGPAPASRAATMHDDPGQERQVAELDDPAGRGVGEELGDADGGQQQRDRQRQEPDARRDRRQPEGHRQEQRHGEEQPGLQQVLEEERGEAAAQHRVPEDRRVDERLGTLVEPPVLPLQEQPEHQPAAEDQPDRRATARATRGADALGRTKPHSPAAQDPEHDQPEAERRQRGADEVEPGARLGRGASAMRRVSDEDRGDDEHLAREHPAPRQVGGEQTRR